MEDINNFTQVGFTKKTYSQSRKYPTESKEGKINWLKIIQLQKGKVCMLREKILHQHNILLGIASFLQFPSKESCQ